MTSDPVIIKLLDNVDPIAIGRKALFIIPEGLFTSDEIETLRKEDKERQRLGFPPWIANFLPDGVRPKGIKKM